MPINNPGIAALPALGTAALADIGTAPGDVPVFDSSGELPFPDHSHSYAPVEHTHNASGLPLLVLALNGYAGQMGLLAMSDAESRFQGFGRRGVGQYFIDIVGIRIESIMLVTGERPQVRHRFDVEGRVEIDSRSTAGTFTDGRIYLSLFRI